MIIENITTDKIGLSVNGMFMQIEVYEKEIGRLNNVISELEKWLNNQMLISLKQEIGYYKEMLDKLNELRGKE